MLISVCAPISPRCLTSTPATNFRISFTLTTGSDEIAVLSINVTMRALFPSTDGTLLPVTDTESNFNVFPNESVVFKSADLAARQELDKIVRTTATRQPHVRFIKFKRIFKCHTPAKVRNNHDNPKLRGIRSAERIFFVNLKIIGGMAIGDSKIHLNSHLWKRPFT